MTTPVGGLHIVVLGGGTGLPAVLTALKNVTPRLTAVVAMSDDGGSSGRLREELGCVPPGDIRNCLVALAEEEALLSRLFQYRFPEGAGLAGHSLGNLFLTALSELAGGFDRAIGLASQVLAIRGRVLPVTLEKVHLRARLKNGDEIAGESKISQSRSSRIEEVWLHPNRAPSPAPGVLENLREADVIILGPGSLFTSLIPTLLVRGVPEAIRSSRAVRIHVANLMTQPGETDGFVLEDHLEALLRHAPGGPRDAFLEVVLANNAPPDPGTLERYARVGSAPVVPRSRSAVLRFAREFLELPLQSHETLARHDPVKLRAAILNILGAAPEPLRGETDKAPLTQETPA